MKKKRQPDTVFGVAVYLPHQWSRLLATAEDRDKLEDTWEEWNQVFQETKSRLRSLGVQPTEVVVDLDAFDDYCRERGLKNNAGSRAQYVAVVLSQMGTPRESAG